MQNVNNRRPCAPTCAGMLRRTPRSAQSSAASVATTAAGTIQRRAVPARAFETQDERDQVDRQRQHPEKRHYSATSWHSWLVVARKSAEVVAARQQPEPAIRRARRRLGRRPFPNHCEAATSCPSAARQRTSRRRSQKLRTAPPTLSPAPGSGQPTVRAQREAEQPEERSRRSTTRTAARARSPASSG